MGTEATLHKSGVSIAFFCLSHPIFQPDNVAQSHFIWHSLDKSSPCWKPPTSLYFGRIKSGILQCLLFLPTMANFSGKSLPCMSKKAICSSECCSRVFIPSSNPVIVIPSPSNQPIPELLKGSIGTTQCNIFNCEFVEFQRNSSSWRSQNLVITRNALDPQLQAGNTQQTFL